MSAIYVAVMLLLCAYAHAADRLVECEPQRVHDNRYWSYRIVDGRACWYPGRPGKPKYELRWSRPLPSEQSAASEAEQPGGNPVAPSAAPAREEVMPDEPNRGRSNEKSEREEGSNNAVPLSSELTAGALMTAGIQRLLETERPPPPIVAPPPRPATKNMSVWEMTLAILGVVGLIALIPIYRGVRNG
jgi:hypothetical protein